MLSADLQSIADFDNSSIQSAAVVTISLSTQTATIPTSTFSMPFLILLAQSCRTRSALSSQPSILALLSVAVMSHSTARHHKTQHKSQVNNTTDQLDSQTTVTTTTTETTDAVPAGNDEHLY